MKHYMLGFVIGLILINSLKGQVNPGFEKVYEGFVTNQKALGEKGVEELKSAFAASGESDFYLLYQLAVGEYCMIGQCLSNENCKNVEPLIEKAIKRSEQLLKNSDYASKGHALLGALIAMKIELNRVKAIFLGPQSTSHTEKAIELGADDPAAWVELGNLRFHAPALFGGDNKDAIRCFRKAISLYDADPEIRSKNWLYLHAYAWLGQALVKEGKVQEAIDVYSEALAYEPRFTWIKDELLVSAQKQVLGK